MLQGSKLSKVYLFNNIKLEKKLTSLYNETGIRIRQIISKLVLQKDLNPGFSKNPRFRVGLKNPTLCKSY